MTRLLACAAILAAAAFAPAASADEICVGVDKVGTLGPPLVLGPQCVPYVGPPVCRTTKLGHEPTLVLLVATCAGGTPS